MALVTGNLTTFGLNSNALAQPTITFTPSGPATTGVAFLLVSKPVAVTPVADGSGAFTVNLQPTDAIQPLRWYTVKVEWLDSAGNYTAVDFIDWKLYVPSNGGQFADLIDTPTNPQLVWTSLVAPPNPTPGTWWFEADPADPMNLSNPANLYEWSN